MRFPAPDMAGVADLKLTTPIANFGSRARSRTAHRFYVDPEEHARWRPSAYRVALRLARDGQATRVVDFGARAGVELSDAFGAAPVEAIGVDYGYLIDRARERFPRGRWLACHLTDYDDLDAVYREVAGPEPVLLIAADVLEHLEDPRPFLAALRRLLVLDDRNRAVIGIADRPATRVATDDRIPADPTHVREWSVDELLALLRASGFEAEPAERAGSADPPAAAILVARASQAGYEAFLERHRLPPSTLERVVVVTEQAAPGSASGIGTYVEELESLCPPGRLAICLLDETAAGVDAAAGDRRRIRPSTFFEGRDLGAGVVEDLSLRLAEQVVFFYPNLRVLEYQDAQGIGARICQARRAAFLPGTLNLDARGHGSLVYSEYASQRWLGRDAQVAAYKEKIGLELADRVSLPTRFLHRLYVESGYELDPGRVTIERYPFRFPEAPPDVAYDRVDTLIFFGRRSPAKGIAEFVEAADRLRSTEEGSRVTTLILLGPTDDAHDAAADALQKLRAGVDVRELCPGRAEARAVLAQQAGRAVCVLPYQSADHPFALLEAVASGCPVVATDVGGIPEIVPAPFHPDVLCSPDAESLADAIRRAMAWSPERRRAVTRSLFEALAAEQAEINRRYLAERLAPVAAGGGPRRPDLPGVTVIVPCYRTNLEYIRDLIGALNEQVVRPERVVFVDDASGPGYADELERLAGEGLLIPFQVVRNERNLGEAGARSTGLKHSTSELTVNVDSDNIPKPEFVRRLVDYFRRDPNVAAVSAYNVQFEDGVDWADAANMRGWYRPLGDGIVVSLMKGKLGDATGGYDTRVVKEAGGWDYLDRARNSDRSLYLRLRCSGKRLGVIPVPTYLYRIRPGSVARTLSRFLADRKVARNFVGLHRFDALRIFGVLQELRRLRRDERADRQVEQLRRSHRRLETELTRLRSDHAGLAAAHDELLRSYEQLAEAQRARTQVDLPTDRAANGAARGGSVGPRRAGLASWVRRTMRRS